MIEHLSNKIKAAFVHRYTNNEPVIIASPGRINLIGEHTDYNHGLVFPAAIDKYIIGVVARNNKEVSRIYSADLDQELILDFNHISTQENGSWKNYVIGVVSELLKIGASIQNFDMVFGGDIPIGAGLSSSAALENSVVFGLNELYELELDKEQMALISQRAEHYYAGVSCGIMDQFANMYGKTDQAILLNCDDHTFQLIPIQLFDYQFLLINTNVKHELSDSPYNHRKEQCKEGLKLLQEKFPELKLLNDAEPSQLEEIKTSIPHEIYKRCKYIIEENARVKSSKAAIESNDWGTFGKLLYASHEGLQHLFEVSCCELDFLVAEAKKHNAVIGSRMMGGGFGGCTINLVKKSEVKRFEKFIVDIFNREFGHKADVYPVKISNGIQLITS